MSDNRKVIKVKCKGSREVEWRKLSTELQGDLKISTREQIEKFKRRLCEMGFDMPFCIWEGHNEVLDGKRRTIALTELESEGWEIPEKLPAVEIFAKTKKEAKKRVLGYISQFGRVDEQGLYDFQSDFNWDELTKNIDIPDINLDEFNKFWLNDENNVKIDESKKTITVTIELNSQEEYIFSQVINFALNENETQMYDNTMRFIMDQYGLNARSKALIKLCEYYLISHGRQVAG